MPYERSVRIGVLHTGLFAEHAFVDLAHTIEPIYIRRFKRYLIWKYHVFVIPFHTDQIFLDAQKSLLEKYVHSGGVLLLLGASAEVRKWTPLCQWENTWPTSISISTTGKDAEYIFKDIAERSDDYLKYHASYYGHGSISDIHANDLDVQYLAEDRSGRKIMVIRRLRNGGTLFVTTLDPDHHAVAGVPGKSSEGVETTHSKAKHLLANILYWALIEAQSKPKRRLRFFRYIAGAAFFYATQVAIYILPVFSLGLFAYFASNRESLKVLDISYLITASLAVLGSLASILSVCRDIRTEHKN